MIKINKNSSQNIQKFNLNHNIIKALIFDTAGQEKYSPIATTYYREFIL